MVPGICRWCYERTASPKTRWHLYCLNAYRVASDQHPDEIQHALCEMCGDPSDEMDHRLAIEVARALDPAAMLRAFTLDNLRWLCHDCHTRKTKQDRRLAQCPPPASTTPQLVAVVPAAMQSGTCSAERDFSRRTDSSRRRVR